MVRALPFGVMPALVTDAIVQPRTTQQIEGDGFLVVLTPERPDYRYGNCVVFREEPTIGKVMDALRQFHSIFPVPDPLIVWEAPFQQAQQQRLAAPTDVSLVMRYTGEPSSPRADAADVEVERATQKDWDEVVQLCIELFGDADFYRWRYGAFAELIESGSAEWWVSKRESRVIGAAGFVRSPPWGRFQNVMVSPQRRRQGVASKLIRRIVGCHENQDLCVIAVADYVEGVHVVYRNLGFEPVGWQLTITADQVRSVLHE